MNNGLLSISLAVLLCFAAQAGQDPNQVPDFLGIVDAAGLKKLENKPTHVVLYDKDKTIDGQLVSITTMQKDGSSLRLLEIAEGRRKKRYKPTEIKTLYIDRQEYLLRIHVPTQSLYLIDKPQMLVVAKQYLNSRRAQLAPVQPPRDYKERTAISLKFAQDAAGTVGEPALAKELANVILVTDMPEAQVEPFGSAIDRVVEQLNQMFSVASMELLGPGKPVLAVFVDRTRMNTFETEVMKANPIEYQNAILHDHRDRTVISIEDSRSGQHLVWQAAWGLASEHIRFAHSNIDVAPWLQSGMQQRCADIILPRINVLRTDMQKAKMVLFQTRSLNGLLVADEVAESSTVICKFLVGYLQNLSEPGFQQLFEQVKLGLTFDDALQRTFGMTEQDWIAGFGQSLGLPGIQP